jgi:hypothetical protein
MTFSLDINSLLKRHRDTPAQHALRNLISKFINSLSNKSMTLSDRYEKNIPMLEGLEEWVRSQYNITITTRYESYVRTHGQLFPHPMEKLSPVYCDQYIPVDALDCRNFRTEKINSQRVYHFMDPVFVGPRLPAERKFFQSQRIKLGLRRKINPPVSSFAWRECQTPELQRWNQDLTRAKELFLQHGLTAANDWATEQGYDNVQFSQTHHLKVVDFSITLPGCEGVPDQEKLLFVMKFAGLE